MTVDRVVSLLGGPELVGNEIVDPLSMAEATEAGLPLTSLTRLKEALGLSDGEVAEVLGVSVKTIGRLRKAPHRRLPSTASDRLFRLARLYVLAVDVLEDAESARSWLTSPQRGLRDMIPLELSSTDAGSREVEALLLRIEHGVVT